MCDLQCMCYLYDSNVLGEDEESFIGWSCVNLPNVC